MNGSGVNSPAAAVSFTVLSRTPRRSSYFQNSTIALAMLIYIVYGIASKTKRPIRDITTELDTGLHLKTKMPIRDLTTELESRSKMEPSYILG